MAISLPLHESSDQERLSRRSRWPLVALALPALALVHLSPFSPISLLSVQEDNSSAPSCAFQPEPVLPATELVLPEGYRSQSAERLSKAVQIATISYDDNGLPTEDARWKPFYEFHDFLQQTFPIVFERNETTLEKINTLGLLVTIQGSDPSLKPLLLLSHQDVTPAPLETYDRWTHPPFSGFIDDDFVYGRGSGDDKTLLIAQYEALSLLLSSSSFVPRRTIILSHGFDEEEVFARQGAGELAKELEKRYGANSMLMVIDEGSSNAMAFGAEMALPATSEKGYADVKITVGTLGGHSSVPPSHSGIGIIADIIHAIEANPYPTSFSSNDDPLLGYLVCAAEHAPKFPSAWKKLLKGGRKGIQKLSQEFGKQGLMQHSLVSTTQAIDVINGGSKVNSLPEEVTFLMNHRIAFSSSVAATQRHLSGSILPVAKKFGLTTSFFDTSSDVKNLGSRYVKVELLGLPLEPAPRSPTRKGDGVWELFAGTIKGIKPMVVSTFSSTGNTDTKVYHNLSKNVYRYTGSPAGFGGGGAHTVDEKASIDAHLGIVKWIHSIVQTSDAYTGEE